jgi:hypothetical protein
MVTHDFFITPGMKDLSMSYTSSITTLKNINLFTAILIGLTLALTMMPSVFAQDDADITHDGLHRVEGSKADQAYIDPEADFSVFEYIMILEPHVAFRSNWQRDQNRSRRSNRIRQSDMDRIKADVAALLKEVFIERLQENDGLGLVAEQGPSVLLLRPAIIDLDITAPDTQTAGRSTSFTASAGAATIILELFDADTGDIIGRAVDRQTARTTNRMSWSNSVSNRAEARRMLERWATGLRERLDQARSSTKAAAD